MRTSYAVSVEIHSSIAMRIRNATLMPRKWSIVTGKDVNVTPQSSIQGLLHLVKRAGRICDIPNVLPHFKLRASWLETKKVDPHLAIAVEWNGLG